MGVRKTQGEPEFRPRSDAGCARAGIALNTDPVTGMNSDPRPFDFGAFPVLTTPRLHLRELTPADRDSVFAFRSDAEVQRFNADPMRDVGEADVFIAERLADYRGERAVLWAVTARDAPGVIGTVALFNWSPFHRRAEIGYDLARGCWGRGIASEAVGEVLRFGFAQMRLHRAEAATIADNTRSVRMLERLGFVREGTRRECSMEDDGTFHDSAIYGLLAHDGRQTGIAALRARPGTP